MLRGLKSLSAERPNSWFSATLRSSLPAVAATALLGLLLSRAVIMGELYPFGISFLAALCTSQPHLGKYALGGVVAGTLLSVKGTLLISYLAAYGMIYIILCRSQRKERYWLVVPALVMAVNLLSRGVITYINGNDPYTWAGVMFESFFSGVLALVASTGLQAIPKIRRSHAISIEEKTSLGIVLMGCLVGLASLEAGGISVQSVLSRCLVLLGGLLAGPGGGASVGVAVGLIPSIQGTLAAGPIAFYSLAGLLGGVFNSFGRAGVMVGFTLGNLLLTLFFPDQLAIVHSFWETGLALILFIILSQFRIQERLGQEESDLLEKQDLSWVLREKLQKVSQVFSELEKVFQVTSPREETTELNALFDKVAGQVCEGCSIRKVCWEQDFYKTYRALLDVCAKLEKTGNVTERDYSPDIKRRCMRLRELNLSLSHQLEYLRAQASYQKQLENAAKLINQQLGGLARLIWDFAEDLKTEAMCDKEMAQFLKDKLWNKGLQVRKIAVTVRPDGERELVVSQDPCQDKSLCRAMVAPNISQILGKTYAAKELVCAGRGYCSYTLAPNPAFMIKVGSAKCPKEGGQVSGDVCSAVDLPDNKTLLIISDGMGTGEEALSESTTALKLLEKMLLSGFSVDTALKTVNTALLLRSGQEKFATLDVAIINRVNGQADFIKLGGAPSLICTPRGIRVVQGATPPAGILEYIETQNVRQELSPEDLLIMMSDGVWEAIHKAGGPTGWLEDVLKGLDYSNPHKVASYLLYLAKKATGSRAKDDMCVQVAWLGEADIA